MKRRWISSPRCSSSNCWCSTAACTASVISTNRTVRRNATSGTPASAHASTTGAGTCSRQVEPSSTAIAAAPCSSSEPIHARWAGSRVPAPIPVVSTSSPPLSRSDGSAISITCAQRSARPSASRPVTTSGSPRRTTGSSSTSASVSIRTVTDSPARHAAVSIASARAARPEVCDACTRFSSTARTSPLRARAPSSTRRPASRWPRSPTPPPRTPTAPSPPPRPPSAAATGAASRPASAPP